MTDTLSPIGVSHSGVRPRELASELATAAPGTRPLSGLTINAAFLQEIKEDNRHLKELWDRMLPLVTHAEVARNHWLELDDLLVDLLDQLGMHFSLEEAYGYFDDAIDAAPHLSVQAESLRSQHGALFTQARGLVEQMGELDADDGDEIAKWIHRFDGFRRAFEQHEESELKLILQSFEDDLGVGD